MPSDRKHITAVLEEEKEVKDFIYGGKKTGPQPSSPLASREAGLSATQPAMKSGKISIRLPQNLAEKLSQVWYERGFAYAQGKLPDGQVREKQEIIAEALQEWLEKRGYLPEKSS
jgi:hypothetical protein